MTDVVLPWSRIVIIVFRRRGAGGDVAAADAHAPRPVRARRDAEPAHGVVRGREYRPRRHLGLRAGLRHRRPGRLRAVADRQRRPGSRPELHRRLVHGGRARRRGATCRHGVRGAGPRRGQQVPRILVGRGARQDRRARLHHRIHPEASAGHVRPQGPLGGGMIMTVRDYDLLFACTAAAAGRRRHRRVARVIWFPVLLNLLVPPRQPVPSVRSYWVTLIGKIMCYAIVALAMDLIWGYTGILSLGHGLFFALGGYAFGMYLMRQIGLPTACTTANCRTSWCSSTGRPIPGTGRSPITSPTRCCWSCWCRACWPSCSVSSPSARGSRACTSRSSPRR